MNLGCGLDEEFEVKFGYEFPYFGVDFEEVISQKVETKNGDNYVKIVSCDFTGPDLMARLQEAGLREEGMVLFIAEVSLCYNPNLSPLLSTISSSPSMVLISLDPLTPFCGSSEYEAGLKVEFERRGVPLLTNVSLISNSFSSSLLSFLKHSSLIPHPPSMDLGMEEDGVIMALKHYSLTILSPSPLIFSHLSVDAHFSNLLLHHRLSLLEDRLLDQNLQFITIPFEHCSLDISSLLQEVNWIFLVYFVCGLIR